MSSEETTRTMSQIALDSFGGYQKARQLFDLVAADMETLKTNRRLHRRDAEDAEERAFDKHYSELCGLCGHEKKSKNHQNCKFCMNESKYLQLLFLRKGIFSHDLCLCGKYFFGRLSRVEYVRFLAFARGSARETRGRYERMQHWLTKDVVQQRIELLDKIIGILTSSIERMRRK